VDWAESFYSSLRGFLLTARVFPNFMKKNVKNCYEAITKFDGMPQNNWVGLFAIVTSSLPMQIDRQKINKK
jgi:hypothetical protein